MTAELMTQLGYVLAAGLFIFGLKMLGSPATARRGNMISSIGMLVAIVSALLDQGIVDFTYIAAGMVVGGAIDGIIGRHRLHQYQILRLCISYIALHCIVYCFPEYI